MLLDIYSLFWDTFQSVFFAKRHLPYVYSKWFKNRSIINLILIRVCVLKIFGAEIAGMFR